MYSQEQDEMSLEEGYLSVLEMERGLSLVIEIRGRY